MDFLSMKYNMGAAVQNHPRLPALNSCEKIM